MNERGSSSLLPFEKVFTLEESGLLKEILFKGSEVLERWGYDYIKLPAFEHYEVLKDALGEKARRALVFQDTMGGNLLALRSDFTTQTLRSVGFLKHYRFPVRVYYFGTVFSAEEDSYEKVQIGIELLGAPTGEADAEVIVALYSVLKEIGLRDVKVSLGNVKVVKGLLERVDPSERERVRKAFLEKDITFLREILKDDELSLLPLCQSGEEALNILDRLGMEEVREELTLVGEILHREGVDYVYDLSEVRDFPYYTGIVFEFFHPNIGLPLGGGGRYDNLPKVYGENFPATGGTLYVDRLLAVAPKIRTREGIFIVDKSKDGLGFRVSSLLRAKGYRVGKELVSRHERHSLEYAFEEGYQKAVIIYDERDVKVYSSPVEGITLSLKEFLELF